MIVFQKRIFIGHCFKHSYSVFEINGAPCMIFATTKILIIDVEIKSKFSYGLCQMSRMSAKIERRDGHSNCHGKIFCQVCGNLAG